MSSPGWLRQLRSALSPGESHRGRRASHWAATHRPRLEVLEVRSVPTFLAPVNYAVGARSNDVKVADFNNDGHLDLVTANLISNDVSVLLGNADGTFQPARNTLTTPYPLSLAVGDFNRDGKLDIATANDYVPGNDGVNVLLGQGDGEFVNAAPPTEFEWSSAIAAGDLNADGKLDLVATAVSYDGDSYVNVMLGHGDGTFASSSSGPFSGGFYSLALGDFDGDGKVDVAVPGSVFPGNGDGTLRAPRDLGVIVPAPAVADFNADGKLDVAGLSGTNGLTVQLGNGNGTYGPPITTAVGSDPSSFVLADVNADGRADAAVTDLDGLLWVLLNDGHWPPEAPSLRIGDASVIEGNTGTVNATFTLTLSYASPVNVSVQYAMADITATAGSDYTAASGTVIIPAGQTSATVTVPVRGDRLGETDESFAVIISAATNATIGDGQGIGTILDNEPRITTSDVTKAEGKNGKTAFTFSITLSAAYDQPVTVSFQTVNGTATTGDNDYVARTGTITFNPGETTKTITIDVKGDSKREADESFYLDLFGNSSNSWFTKRRGIGTILNDD
jgi:hypothetical protein